MSHTPGPWNLEHGHRGFVITDGVYDVAVVRDFGNEDNKANAILISAAPDLLAALKAIVEAWEVTGGMCFKNNEIGNARAAIAKAKGE